MEQNHANKRYCKHFFQVKNDKAQRIPLTNTKTRRNLHQIFSRLGLQNSKISLHTFRHSGDTLAFNSNVSIQNIQSHGTWTSECVWNFGNTLFKIIMPPNKWQTFSNPYCLFPLLVGHWWRLASTSFISTLLFKY